MKSNSIGTAIAVVLALAVVIFFVVRSPGMTQGDQDNDILNEDTMHEVDTTNLGIKDIDLGEGLVAEKGTLVTVHYVGTFEDGSIFDSSVARGEPFQFVLGAGQVIAGWDAGVEGMMIGGKRMLTIPSELGYGDQGITDAFGNEVIPGGATLLFEVELLGVESLGQ